MPIPFGLSEDQFATRFRGMLEKHSSALITEMRELLGKPIGNDVTSASIEIFLDEYGESGPSIGIYFDGPNKRVDNSDQSIFPGRHIPLAEFARKLEPFDNTYFTDEDFGGLHIQADVAKTWFAEWWWKAGGWDYAIPLEITVHDDYGDGDSIQLAPGR